MANELPRSGLSRSDTSVRVVRDEPSFSINGAHVDGDYSTEAAIGDRWRDACTTAQDGDIISGHNCVGNDTVGFSSAEADANDLTVSLNKVRLTYMGTRDYSWVFGGQDIHFTGHGTSVLDGGELAGAPTPIGGPQKLLTFSQGGIHTIENIRLQNNKDTGDGAGAANGASLFRTGNVGNIDSSLTVMRNVTMVDSAYTHCDIRNGWDVDLTDCLFLATRKNKDADQGGMRAWTITTVGGGETYFKNVNITNCQVRQTDQTTGNFRWGPNHNSIYNLTIKGCLFSAPRLYDALQSGAQHILKAEDCQNIHISDTHFHHNVFFRELLAMRLGYSGDPENGTIHFQNVTSDSGLFISDGATGLVTIDNCHCGLGRYGWKDDAGDPITNTGLYAHIREASAIRKKGVITRSSFRNVGNQVLHMNSQGSGYDKQSWTIRDRCKFRGNNASTNPVISNLVRDVNHIHAYQDTILEQEDGTNALLHADTDAKRGMMLARNESQREWNWTNGPSVPTGLPFTGVVGVPGHEIITYTEPQGAGYNRYYWSGSDWQADT